MGKPGMALPSLLVFLIEVLLKRGKNTKYSNSKHFSSPMLQCCFVYQHKGVVFSSYFVFQLLFTLQKAILGSSV